MRNLRHTPEQWREVQRRTRHISEVPLANRLLLNPQETQWPRAKAGNASKGTDTASKMTRRGGGSSRHICTPPPPGCRGLCAAPALARGASGEGLLAGPCPPNCPFLHRHHLVPPTWRRQPARPVPRHAGPVYVGVCWRVGKRGRVTLLLMDPNQPVEEANIRRITVSPTSPNWSPLRSTRRHPRCANTPWEGHTLCEA